MIGLARFGWPHWPLSIKIALTTVALVAFAAATAAFIFLRRERQALVTDLRA